MMSVTSVTLNAGLLKVELDNGNDNVQISESSIQFASASLASSSISLSTSRDAGTALLRTITVTDLTRPGASWTFNRTSVQKIEVDNFRTFGDTNTIVSKSSLPTVVDLRNSKGTNRVETGSGNDTVFGSEGNDTIFTNAGNDMIAAGAGNDTINGGLGSDSMFGGADNDTLIDAASTLDANLMYGEAGNDMLFSFCKNDVVDGGADVDTLRVKTGTWIVRNAESITIEVPLGNAITGDNRGTARQAVNRFLQAYNLPTITHGIVLNDSVSGLTESRMLSLVREVKPDATLLSNITSGTIANILLTGKPVIAKFGTAWVVYTGFNPTTKLFSFVGKDGLQHTTTMDLGKRAAIF